MPVYDYACETCDLLFEASRSLSDSDVPAYCPMCDRPAKKQLSVPMTSFTRGAAAASLRAGPTASSQAARWSHGGHSHGPGSKPHSH